MALQLDLNGAELYRVQLTLQQQKQLEKLYRDVAKEVAQRAEQAPRVPSDALRAEYLRILQGQLNERLREVQTEMGKTVRDDMEKVTNAVIEDNIEFLKSVGMPIEGAFSWVPDDVIRSVVTGQIYQGDWTLSRALWNTTKKTQEDIQTVIARGIAENKSAYDIAKDLEKYVNPTARKPWDWNKVYPGTAKKVDYNAQRLARTMVSHAYQQAFVRTTIKNPFVTSYRWEASNSARVCEICADRDGRVFEKDDLPLDHPNGMCTYTAVMELTAEEIADRLGDWAHGAEDPELDEYAKFLYGDKWDPNPPKPEEPEYRYHATKRSSVTGIIEKGLLPKPGHVGKGVYFADSESSALIWTKETSTGGTTLLRVPMEFLKTLQMEEWSKEESGYDLYEAVVSSKIPFDKIEIKVGGDEWYTLSNWAMQYRNSGYNQLSPAAQKRVEKQWTKENKEWFAKHMKG